MDYGLRKIGHQQAGLGYYLMEWLTRFASSALSRITVKSALNPMLWLTAIALCAGLPLSRLFPEGSLLQSIIVYFSIMPIPITCVLALYFGFSKPEKLQSEDYQIRHEALCLIQEKSGRTILDTSSVTTIANPQLRPTTPST
jgi:hypothetical protein